MMRSKSKHVHENFHGKTQVQNKVIAKNNFTYRHLIDFLDKHIKKKTSVLDVGCGAGTLSFYLASAKSCKVTGIDISENAISKCKQTAENLDLDSLVSFIQMDFPYDVPSKKFDFILFTEVIEHLEDDMLAMKKLFALLKPGGILLLTTPSKNAPLYRLGLANNFDKRVGHVRRYSYEGISSLCEAVGFEHITVEKKEGIIRNSLFVLPKIGVFIKVINRFNLSNVITLIDNFSLVFGESDLMVIARKREK